MSVFPMCIKSVFESINSIRHNDIVRKAIPHVYDTISEKILLQLVYTSLYEKLTTIASCEIFTCHILW